MWRKLKNSIKRAAERFPAIKKLLVEITSLKGGPHYFARSVSIGLFVGITVPEGLQTLSSIPSALLFRANFIIISIFTLVTNPFTLLPLYYISYKMGEYITGSTVQWREIIAIIENPSIDAITQQGSNFLSVFIPGSIVHALLWGSVFYYPAYYIYKLYREKRILSNRENQPIVK